MKIAILGYGNLGKAVEKRAIERGLDVVGVFSRRKCVSELGSAVYPLEKFPRYDVDAAFLCFGSAGDMLGLAPLFALQCNTIDAFDNHKEMKYYKAIMNEAASKTNHISLLGCGWDTGIFSVIRSMFFATGGQQATFWGKGISKGHSNAIKTLDGVANAVEITYPLYENIDKNNLLTTESEKRHKRVCYVAAYGNHEQIEQQIRDMSGYFRGYETEINFVSEAEIKEIEKDKSHKGKIISIGEHTECELNLITDDNCALTAEIMINYSNAVNALTKEKKYGAYTVLDVAPSVFLGENAWKML